MTKKRNCMDKQGPCRRDEGCATAKKKLFSVDKKKTILGNFLRFEKNPLVVLIFVRVLKLESRS